MKPSLLIPGVWIGLCVGGVVICVGLTVQLDYARVDVNNASVMFRYYRFYTVCCLVVY